MKQSESIQKLATALSQFQAEVENPKRTAKNPYYNSKYAPFSEVWNACRDLLGKHGLAVIQEPATKYEPRLCISVTTKILHISGEWIEFAPLELIPMKKPRKREDPRKQPRKEEAPVPAIPDPQMMGSAIAYGCRYTLQAALGLPGEDDDGNLATAPPSRDTTHHDELNPHLIKQNRKLLTQLATLHPNHQARVDAFDRMVETGKSPEGVPLTNTALQKGAVRLEQELTALQEAAKLPSNEDPTLEDLAEQLAQMKETKALADVITVSILPHGTAAEKDQILMAWLSEDDDELHVIDTVYQAIDARLQAQEAQHT